jgi:hypothetical protein
MVDYDVLEGDIEEVKDYFERRSPEVISYMKKFLPHEYEKFQEGVREAEQEGA